MSNDFDLTEKLELLLETKCASLCMDNEKDRKLQVAEIHLWMLVRRKQIVSYLVGNV